MIDGRFPMIDSFRNYIHCVVLPLFLLCITDVNIYDVILLLDEVINSLFDLIFLIISTSVWLLIYLCIFLYRNWGYVDINHFIEYKNIAYLI